LIVIQEIFGVNSGMRQMCDEYAKMGYHALCPDLFWRQETGVDITDQSEAEWAKAFGLFKGFDTQLGIKDLISTIQFARKMDGANGKVGSVGFCLGGKLAFLMSLHSDADCNISYYGVGLPEYLSEIKNIKKPTLMHMAALDSFVPKDDQDKIIAAAANNSMIECHRYEGVQHAFARVNGQHFDASAAALAASRSADFLKKYLD
jgi:carboxymethylenebutenolidase